MRRHFVLLVATVALLAQWAAAAEPAPNTLSEEEKAAGWKLLFDGQSTAGWRNYKKTDVGSGWKIEDGALVRAGQGRGRHHHG